MTEIDAFANEPLIVAGRRIDGRTTDAKRFRALASELASQLQHDPTPAERVLLVNAAALAMLCERFAADLLEGREVNEENYRRNLQALGGVMIKLGLAAKSRDVTKRDRMGADDFGAAVIEAQANREQYSSPKSD